MAPTPRRARRTVPLTEPWGGDVSISPAVTTESERDRDRGRDEERGGIGGAARKGLDAVKGGFDTAKDVGARAVETVKETTSNVVETVQEKLDRKNSEQ